MKATKFKPWVTELIENYQGIYATPKNVELIAGLNDGSFYIGCKWVDPKPIVSPRIGLEINREFFDYYAFMEAFPIVHLADLDNITASDLFKLYEQSQMWVNAVMDERGCFWDINFKIIQGITYITNSETNKPIQFEGLLSKPEEIISFTGRYLRSHPPTLDPRMANKIRTREYLP